MRRGGRVAAVLVGAIVSTGTLAGAGAAGPGGQGAGPAVDGTLPACEASRSAWVEEEPWVLDRLGTDDAWPLASRGEGVLVAVVDGGVDDRNPHLQGQVVPGTSLVSAQAEPEGRYDGTTDRINHGTALASLIAAAPVPESGLVGIAPRAKILPVRFFSTTDEADEAAGDGPTVARLAEGIRYAADNGADIINVSISQTGPDPALEEAVRHAQSLDVLVVASAGNRKEGQPDAPRWPAAYPGVIGVTATDKADRVTEASLHSEAVDLAAPGQDVTAAFFDQKDCLYLPGEQDAPATSWATGYVSGAAALVRAAHPQESADQIAYRLMATADRPLRRERDDVRGWGIIQPYQAITMTFDPNRPGPLLPGAAPEVTVPEVEQVAAVEPLTDPLAERRDEVVWWGLLGLAGLGLLLLLTRWNQLTRPRPGGTGPST